MKLVSWNIEGRLSPLAISERGTPGRIIEALRAFDADVSVHPEAFGSEPAPSAETEAALTQMRYTSVSTPYDDALSRGGKAAVINPHLCLLTRLPIVASEVIRPGGLRNMLSVTLHDPVSNRDFRVIATHLDDRTEQLRMRQVTALVEHINSSEIPTIMMGDFNAMPPHRLKSVVVHSSAFKDAAHLIPHKHMRYTLQRLSDMATGTTIATLLSQTRLRNTDPSFRPTTTPKMRRMEWMPSIRFAKIDWLLLSPDIEYKNFAVSPDLGSDHRALSADVFIESHKK